MSNIENPKTKFNEEKTLFVFHINLAVGMIDPVEINYRINIFKRLALKSLCNQDYRNFVAIVYIDKRWRNEEKALYQATIDTHNFIKTIEVNSITETFNRSSADFDFSQCYISHLRLDDDDLLHKKYLTTCATAIISSFEIEQSAEYVFLHSSRGYIYYPDDYAFSHACISDFPIAIGIGIANKASQKLITLPAHNEIFKFIQSRNDFKIIDVGAFSEMWCYTRHRRSDSNRLSSMQKLRASLPDASIEKNENIFQMGLSHSDFLNLQNYLVNIPGSEFFFGTTPATKRLTRVWQIDREINTIQKDATLSQEDKEREILRLELERQNLR